MALSQQCVWSWFRFSVALPLGINGDAQHANTSRYVQLQCGRTPGRNATNTVSLRASRGEASGPRGSSNRKSTAHSSLLKLFAASGEQQRAPTSCSPPPAGAADCAAQRAASVQPNSPPRVRLTAAPLSLRRLFARLRDLRVLRSGRAGPTSRGREMLTHFHWPPLPPFSVRALAEILFKAQDALNDFLLQRSRAGEL